MTYPLPDLIPLLQLLCTPQEYMAALGIELVKRTGAAPFNYPSYRRIIPLYIYAYCPFCGRQYREPADTYSLRAWGGPKLLRSSIFARKEYYPLEPKCEHFLGINRICNLHGNIPDELDNFDEETGEIPYVTPEYVPNDIPSYAILHGLPICRIENNEFVPRYTVFLVTYFAEHPKLIRERFYEEEAKIREHDPEYYAGEPGSAATSARLESWAEQGRLGWLDVTQIENLPLILDKSVPLPRIYRNITGKIGRVYWKKPHNS